MNAYMNDIVAYSFLISSSDNHFLFTTLSLWKSYGQVWITEHNMKTSGVFWFLAIGNILYVLYIIYKYNIYNIILI